MQRVLDLVALRSFVAIVDAGGVTRAAGFLNLTQSAVSMQIRRMEEALNLTLFVRAARKLTLTPEGEQLLSYARRLLALNDEAMSHLTQPGFEGEIRLGVPHDIVYPLIPGILKRLALRFPRVRVNLVSSYTVPLKQGFARGEHDIILTTEETPDRGAEVLVERALCWFGAEGGQIWQARPLRLGFRDNCSFRPVAQAALTAAGIPWEMAVDGASQQAIEATVVADLAVTVRMEGDLLAGLHPIDARAALPPLGAQKIALYATPAQPGAVSGPGGPVAALLAELRAAYRAPSPSAPPRGGSSQGDDNLARGLTVAQQR